MIMCHQTGCATKRQSRWLFIFHSSGPILIFCWFFLIDHVCLFNGAWYQPNFAEEAERKRECAKRQQAMQELCQGGSPTAFRWLNYLSLWTTCMIMCACKFIFILKTFRLKKQVTNDRSAPLVSGFTFTSLSNVQHPLYLRFNIGL